MALVRTSAVAVAALAAAAAAGCGLGPGESSEGDARLTVTRDYGATRMLEATATDPPESETVIRLLDREAEVTTRFGGGFVDSIEGVAGAIEGGRSFDWFFYVNGVESSRGAAEVGVDGGDRIWWDYRDWTAAMRVPAVVGSWPQPFAGAEEPLTVQCEGERGPCDAVAERLADEGLEAAVEEQTSAGVEGPRLLVGPWARIAADPTARLLEDGPATSGVFARFEDAGPGIRLITLDDHGEPVSRLAHGGLVAALRDGEEPPTWVVTGTDAEAVELAAGLLRSSALEDRYAIAADGRNPIELPATGAPRLVEAGR